MKAINEKVKEMSQGGVLSAEDFLNKPKKLRIVKVETEEFESQKDGKTYDRIKFYFEDNAGKELQISVLAFDSLVKVMAALDPDIGDILELRTESIPGINRPVWSVSLVKGAQGETEKVAVPEKTKKAAGRVVTSDDEEEIKIDDIPF